MSVVLRYFCGDTSLVDIGGKKYHYRGNLALLKRPKIAIVGSRRPNNYTKTMTLKLAATLARSGKVIVSGGAMGTDAFAHRGAGAQNTIAVLGSGIDILYPATNRELLQVIGQEGLLLSEFAKDFRPTKWSFVVRNKSVVALGEYLIITQADRSSGSMRSAEIALEMGKKIYVLPHRIGESEGTNDLVRQGLAEVIWDIDEFCGGGEDDPFIKYLQSSPSYEEAVSKWGEKVYEAEIEGLIEIENNTIIYKGGL
ncbi:DNA-processing protein DprA [Nitratiruptor sp. YY09-18]|uniref:DNA-processing protein DprA n=1 Tax=Nitratiruptor sp. YY09-18 TaxID=2724901 RepID=UPI001F15A2B5|nr:DNA-processing protein DprA [Nitratiruptor sp. YY09-18]